MFERLPVLGVLGFACGVDFGEFPQFFGALGLAGGNVLIVPRRDPGATRLVRER